MKRISLLFIVAFASLMSMAQNAVIEFKNKEYDFGQVKEEDGPVTTIFEFTNTGNAPLTLNSVKASCGCTATDYTKSPVEPGKSGYVKARYNVNGRPGKFTKTITVSSNATEASLRLTIKGEVIPRPAEPADKYPVKIGELGLSTRTLMYGDIKKGQRKNLTIDIANNSKEAMTVSLYTDDHAITSDTQPTKLEPGQAGNIVVNFNTDATKTWGTAEAEAYIIVNGKKDLDAAHKVDIRANIIEDFSNLTNEQKQNAPIIRVSQQTINLGDIPAGESKTVRVDISNQGAADPLYIRRIINPSNELKVTPKATTIKSGKSSYLTITVNTLGLGKQSYKRGVTVITNDPDHSRQVLSVNWNVK